MEQSDLMDLLSDARTSNDASGVTGLLLYGDEAFIQAFEGKTSTVDLLYEKIAEDKRHQDVRQIYRQDIEERSFSDWKMAFRPLRNQIKGQSVFPLCRDMLDHALRGSTFLDMKIYMQAFYDIAHPEECEGLI